ncbi:MAG: BadF/BadG/BcrA/BcrD ATPase family protein [Candidatus Pacearchaeota archaeon]
MNVKYYVGLDIGSEFVHSVTFDNSNKTFSFSKSLMHFGNTVETVRKIIYFNKNIGVNEKNSVFCFTGSGGKVFSEVTFAPYFYETLTIPLGANYLMPDARYVFHIGSKDSYFFEKFSAGEYRVYVPDFSTGTKCGGGSGILLNKQCRRIFAEEVDENLDMQTAMEKMYELAYLSAIDSDKDIDVGGRCGVVIQSDMIHLQNSGESINNILRGLFERIAKNYKADVVRIRNLDKNSKAIATGGVSLNKYIVKMLEKHLDVKIFRPENSEKVGAIGACLKLKELKEFQKVNLEKIDKVIYMQKKEILYTNPLYKYLKFVKVNKEKDFLKHGDLKIFVQNYENDKIPVVMGIDGGSTTTKAVLLKFESLDPVAEICIETHGRPLNACQKIFKQIKDYFKEKLDIKAVAYTGSSGAFYYKLFTKPGIIGGSDIVIDEITCHALGVKSFNSKVDTIFELGGQDAKFTVFSKDGVVKKAKMNLSCMAGTGQTMQNMIKMIGLNYEEFERFALSAKKTPIVDDTCGVFTEAGIAKLISLGLPKEEIAAAIAYAFIGGYINKFVGSEKFGEFISAQGGPFNNLACLAALALHTKRKINAFPHRQLFGAYGAAIAAYNKFKDNNSNG